jgi:hypothetical protein
VVQVPRGRELKMKRRVKNEGRNVEMKGGGVAAVQVARGGGGAAPSARHDHSLVRPPPGLVLC